MRPNNKMESIKFNKIGIKLNKFTSRTKKIIVNLFKLLKKLNCKIFVDKILLDFICPAEDTLQIINIIENKTSYNLLISIGGDGTFISSSKDVLQKNIPIIGINSGKVGFLADIAPKEIDSKLKDILLGEYIIEKRSLIESQTNNLQNTILVSLNEIMLTSGNHSNIINFMVFSENELLFSSQSNGLIFSTATGSTAYSMSCGGPILYPNANATVITPISPYINNINPMIVSNKTNLTVKIYAKKNDSVMIYSDGIEKGKIKNNDILTIKKAQMESIFIHHKTYSYYDYLKKKLISRRF